MIRAFRSTLEDLEERRSVHSLHSLRNSRSGATTTNSTNPGLYAQTTATANALLAPPSTRYGGATGGSVPLTDISYIDEDANGEAAAAGVASKRKGAPTTAEDTRI